MSIQAINSYIDSFDPQVKLVAQLGGKLGETVRIKDNVVGKSWIFPVYGRGLATPRITQTNVVPMNIAHTKATANLTDWIAPEYVDVYDMEKMEWSELKALAQVVGTAITRREDQLIINALVAGANATTVDTNVGGSNTGFNLEKLLRAKRLLDDNGIPDDGDRYLVTSFRAIEQALQIATFNSQDYNILKPLYEGSLPGYAGFKFKMIETRAEGGLPIAANLRSHFAYHKSCIGLARGIDLKTETNYIPEKTSWLVSGMYSAGAVVIDNLGVFRIQTTEA